MFVNPLVFLFIVIKRQNVCRVSESPCTDLLLYYMNFESELGRYMMKTFSSVYNINGFWCNYKGAIKSQIDFFELNENRGVIDL